MAYCQTDETLSALNEDIIEDQTWIRTSKVARETVGVTTSGRTLRNNLSILLKIIACLSINLIIAITVTPNK
jgi:hypothetical protein